MFLWNFESAFFLFLFDMLDQRGSVTLQTTLKRPLARARRLMRALKSLRAIRMMRSFRLFRGLRLLAPRPCGNLWMVGPKKTLTNGVFCCEKRPGTMKWASVETAEIQINPDFLDDVWNGRVGITLKHTLTDVELVFHEIPPYSTMAYSVYSGLHTNDLPVLLLPHQHVHLFLHRTSWGLADVTICTTHLGRRSSGPKGMHCFSF